MRHKIKIIQDGEIRIKSRFLFSPKQIGNEVRWFEYAKWEEYYDDGYDDSGWIASKWLN